MSKQKRNIIAVILCLITLAVAVGIFFTTNKDSPTKDNESEIVSSDVSSNINIEDIESEKDNTESETNATQSEIEFLEPDESKADKILEESKNNKNTSSENKPQKQESSNKNSSVEKTEESSEPNGGNNGPQTFEDGQKENENKTDKYLKEHNIDPKTAGETGELCPHCSKKLWNPDKYGDFIPGMPEDYENSGYCLGTCAITFG